MLGCNEPIAGQHGGSEDAMCDGRISTMKTTIDAAGRIVVPKAIRESVGLAGGSQVEIREVDGLIEIEPVATEFRVVKRGGIPVAVADRPIPMATDEEFRETLERIRDERTHRLLEGMRDDRG